MLAGMLTEPVGFDRAELVAALRFGWQIEALEVEYLPVGFGSHHWRVRGDDRREWFVSGDEAPTEVARDRLSRALITAAALRESGLEFVHAPLRNADGGCVTLAGDLAVSVTSYVDGLSYEYGDYPDEGLRGAVLAALGRLHRATGVSAGLTIVDDLVIAGRGELPLAMQGDPWRAGPYGGAAQGLVAGAWRRIQEMFDRYDDLAAAVASTVDSWVITHGEPHPGNVMSTSHGILLIDWETALLAPRERDLWRLPLRDQSDRRAYGGQIQLDEAALALYRLRWDLADICAFAGQLRDPHVDDDDARLALSCLRGYLAG